MSYTPADDLIMVRYKAGCGGETFALALHQTFNTRPAITERTPLNQTTFRDVFDSTFHFMTLTPEIAEREGLSSLIWRDMPLAEIKAFVRRKYEGSSDRIKVGKGHPNLPLDYEGEAYEPAFFIDLLPYRRHCFVPRAILYHKRAFTKATVLVEAIVSSHPQFPEVQRFFASRGWYPAYWADCLLSGLNIHDLPTFVAETMGRHLFVENTRLYPGSHLALSAADVLLDESLSAFEAVAARYDARLPDAVRADLARWVRSNRAILANFGLLERLDDDLSMDEQAALLLPLAERLACALIDPR